MTACARRCVFTREAEPDASRRTRSRGTWRRSSRRAAPAPHGAARERRGRARPRRLDATAVATRPRSDQPTARWSWKGNWTEAETCGNARGPNIGQSSSRRRLRDRPRHGGHRRLTGSRRTTTSTTCGTASRWSTVDGERIVSQSGAPRRNATIVGARRRESTTASAVRGVQCWQTQPMNGPPTTVVPSVSSV